MIAWAISNLSSLSLHLERLNLVEDIKDIEITDDSYQHLRNISIREDIHGVDEPEEGQLLKILGVLTIIKCRTIEFKVSTISSSKCIQMRHKT